MIVRYDMGWMKHWTTTIASLKASVLSYIEHRDTQLDRRSEEGEPFIICTTSVSYTHLTLPTKRIV